MNEKPPEYGSYVGSLARVAREGRLTTEEQGLLVLEIARLLDAIEWTIRDRRCLCDAVDVQELADKLRGK